MQDFILDTNLYLSYFTKRNVDQYLVAKEYIQKLEEKSINIILPNLILAEVVYILSYGYMFDRNQVTDVLMSLLSEKHLLITNKDIALIALELFKSSGLDFADCYLLAYQKNSRAKLITFDKKLKNNI